jgi:hypothetical protein
VLHLIEINRPATQQIAIIRAATGYELSNYEKQKLANIEDNAQKNKIESITVNGQRLPIDSVNKEVNINLGSLAFKSQVTPEELSPDKFFFIKCDLDDATLKGNLK